MSGASDHATSSTSRAVDVVVVGGGIVGTSAAAFLAELGASVVLVERDGLASGASGANSGVVQHPFDPVLAALYYRTVDLYRDLAAVSNGFPFAARPAGMLYVSHHEQAARNQHALIHRAFPSLGLEVLGGKALRALEPAAGPDLWACRVDIGFPVAPGASTYAYATLAESRGAAVRVGRAATIELEGDRAVGVRVDGRMIPAGAVLVAAGPWTTGLLDPTGRWAPIAARWGVVVEVELGAPPRHVLEEAGIEAVLDAGGSDDEGDTSQDDEAGVEFSLVPFAGASAVGSTFLAREPVPADWMERILVRASSFVPAVAEAPIRGVRACARPQSVDARPLVGAVPGRRDLYVCAGHGPWGISTGPGSSRLAVDLILGRAPEIPAELDPARFGTPGG